MQSTLKNQASQLKTKLTSLMFVFITLLVWTLGRGVWAPSATLEALGKQPEPKLLVITVCPEGPPTCQFAKIQDAINAAPETGSPPAPAAKIRVAPGTYEENLLILKSVILEGVDRDQVILRPRPGGGRETDTVVLIVGWLGAAIFEISGLTIQQAQTGGSIGIFIIGETSGHIYNNRFQNAEAGIKAIGAGYLVIHDNLFEEGALKKGAGISLVESYQTWIFRNTFLNLSKVMGSFGIAVSSARSIGPQGSEIWIAYNTIEGIWGSGISVSDSGGIKIQENVISKSSKGIVVNRSRGISISGNIIRDNRTQGIEINSASVLLMENRIEGNQGDGVGVMDLFASAPEAALFKNQIFKNGRFGIWAERPEYVIFCRDNQLAENKTGDYGSGLLGEEKPSPELKQKCEAADYPWPPGFRK